MAGCVTNDYGEQEGVDKAAVKKIMTTLGATDPDAKPIDYKERAPLAMPTNMASLPAPETKTASQTAANWPKADDTEMKRLKAIYAKNHTSSNSDDDTKRLTPEQMRGLNIEDPNKAPRDAEKERRADQIADGSRLTTQEMKAQHNQANAAEAAVEAHSGQKLARRYLVDPPADYNTPSAAAPFKLPTKTVDNEARRKEREMSGARIDMNCTPSATDDCTRGGGGD